MTVMAISTMQIHRPDLETGSVFYADADGDGFGSTTEIAACVLPEGAVENMDDCDDDSADVNPDASEVCDEIDNDCDGDVDDDDDSLDTTIVRLSTLTRMVMVKVMPTQP